MISRDELYKAVVYYHTSRAVTLSELTKAEKDDIPDINIDEVKTFFSVNIFGGLESFISYKTKAQIEQMFFILDKNSDGKISK